MNVQMSFSCPLFQELGSPPFLTWYNKLTLFIFSLTVETLQNPDEDRLLRDLFKDYNKDVRPVVNMSQAVQVTFGITFSQIIDVVGNNRIAVIKRRLENL